MVTIPVSLDTSAGAIQSRIDTLTASIKASVDPFTLAFQMRRRLGMPRRTGFCCGMLIIPFNAIAARIQFYLDAIAPVIEMTGHSIPAIARHTWLWSDNHHRHNSTHPSVHLFHSYLLIT